MVKTEEAWLKEPKHNFSGETVRFGKYRGSKFRELPDTYIRFMADSFDNAMGDWARYVIYGRILRKTST